MTQASPPEVVLEPNGRQSEASVFPKRGRDAEGHRVVAWGTYDMGKPRNRIFFAAMKALGIEVSHQHHTVWDKIEDKSQVNRVWSRLGLLVKWAAAYPRLLCRYAFAPSHEIVWIGYLGVLDVLCLWPLVRLKGKPIIWDMFLSLYDTVVRDRKLVSKNHVLARVLYALEWLATRAADVIVLDTKSHAAAIKTLYSLPDDKLARVFVGAEEQYFPLLEPSSGTGRTTVLFYGQFIPLHGVATILAAAQEMDDPSFEWVFIGEGQESDHIRSMLQENPISNLRWIPWVPYDELTKQIENADICLGIFGDSEKAKSVVPNKIYQALLSGRPIITADTPALRELVGSGVRGMYLVPPRNPQALCEALSAARHDLDELRSGEALFGEIREKISCSTLAAQWRQVFRDRW